MRKLFALLASLFITVAADAKVVFLNQPTRIISSDEITFEKIEELIHSRNNDVTIEFREGTSFPIKFLVKTRLLSGAMDPNLAFRVDKTCYLRIVNRKCYLSEDFVEWQKPARFFEGGPSIHLIPGKGGLTVQTTLVPVD